MGVSDGKTAQYTKAIFMTIISEGRAHISGLMEGNLKEAG
jgi:hypothetical protein